MLSKNMYFDKILIFFVFFRAWKTVSALKTLEVDSTPEDCLSTLNATLSEQSDFLKQSNLTINNLHFNNLRNLNYEVQKIQDRINDDFRTIEDKHLTPYCGDKGEKALAGVKASFARYASGVVAKFQPFDVEFQKFQIEDLQVDLAKCNSDDTCRKTVLETCGNRGASLKTLTTTIKEFVDAFEKDIAGNYNEYLTMANDTYNKIENCLVAAVRNMLSQLLSRVSSKIGDYPKKLSDLIDSEHHDLASLVDDSINDLRYNSEQNYDAVNVEELFIEKIGCKLYKRVGKVFNNFKSRVEMINDEASTSADKLLRSSYYTFNDYQSKFDTQKQTINDAFAKDGYGRFLYVSYYKEDLEKLEDQLDSFNTKMRAKVSEIFEKPIETVKVLAKDAMSKSSKEAYYSYCSRNVSKIFDSVLENITAKYKDMFKTSFNYSIKLLNSSRVYTEDIVQLLDFAKLNTTGVSPEKKQDCHLESSLKNLTHIRDKCSNLVESSPMSFNVLARIKIEKTAQNLASNINGYLDDIEKCSPHYTCLSDIYGQIENIKGIVMSKYQDLEAELEELYSLSEDKLRESSRQFLDLSDRMYDCLYKSSGNVYRSFGFVILLICSMFVNAV